MILIAGSVGAGLIFIGVVMGFVKDGGCGSVFRPADEVAVGIELLGRRCPATEVLAVPVWVLLGVGGALLAGALIAFAATRLSDRQRLREKPAELSTR